jgi:UDP-N-acetylmuramate dehydrogenase
MNWFERLSAECPGAWKREEPLSRHTSIRVGGPAEAWFEPSDLAALARAVKLAGEAGVPWRVMGGGSNALAADEGVRGLVIHLDPGAAAFGGVEAREDGTVRAGAALPLGLLLKYLIDQGYGECEFLYGIPAQVGGAVAMNAGSSSRWVDGYFIEGTRVDSLGGIIKFDRAAARFGYRSSALGGSIVTEAVFGFPRVAPEVTRANIATYQEYRQKTQDLKNPNCGCMFANPEGQKSAGRLIDEAGLKGCRIGGAGVSTVHGNFVMNYGGATAGDVAAVMDLAEKTVFEKFGVRLRREIRVFK